jgi:hypothetical protein
MDVSIVLHVITFTDNTSALTTSLLLAGDSPQPPSFWILSVAWYSKKN